MRPLMRITLLRIFQNLYQESVLNTDLPTNTVPHANSLDRPTSCSIDRSLQVPAKQSPLEATGAYIRRALSCEIVTELSQLEPQESATCTHSTHIHTSDDH
jgi:hypothetical protein